MKYELKSFQWQCDCCGAVKVTQANALYNARPEGWITARSFCGDFECRGDHEADYCDKCIAKAKKNHNLTEDTHWGQILRSLEKK